MPAPTLASPAGLDAEQRAAAECGPGPLLIVAGPGSGKTRTLTHRIARLALQSPDRACLAITFTRRAAAEMRERLAALLPAGAAPVAVHTFHSLGLEILRAQANAAGLHRGFRIAGEAERLALLAETMALTERRAASLLRAISKAKRQAEADGEIAAAMGAYQQALTLRNWIDFDDLVRLTVEMLTRDAGLAALYRDRFRWISVDEFQDVDEQQYRLLTLLAAPPAANLCVIGDPDQAIYGFRGADASCFDRFAVDYAGATVASLRRNYRSSGTIVSAATQVIARRLPDSCLDMIVRGMEARIAIHEAPTERAEAEFVVHQVEQLIGGHSFFSIDSGRTAEAGRAGLGFGDFAVLYRTAAQAAALCEAFARSGIPFKTSSHEPLAADPAVRALIGGIEDETPDRPLPARLQAAAELLAGREAPGLEPAAVAIALQRLSALAAAGDGDPIAFADALATATEADFWDPRADRVSLLTLHAAKGLEFPVVFIIGIEDGILPLSWGPADEAAAAEERRLFYVGMTRAKDRLILCRARQRNWRGRLQDMAASPFLADIEAALLRHQPMPPLPRRPEDRQLKLF